MWTSWLASAPLCAEVGLPGPRAWACRAGGQHVRPGRLRASPLTRSLFRAPSLLSRSLVDTVYALKDEVQELRQVGRRPSLIFLLMGEERKTWR